MAEEKPVSTPDWVKQLREDIKKDVDATVHNQLTEFYAGYIKAQFEEMESEISSNSSSLKRDKNA